MFSGIVFGLLFTTVFALNLSHFKNTSFASSRYNIDVLPLNYVALAQQFENEYVSYLKNGKESQNLSRISRQLAKSHTRDIVIAEVENLDKANQIFMCTSCRATTNVLFRMFREGGEFADPEYDTKLRETMLDICNRLEIHTEEVCRGVVDIHFDVARYIINESQMDSRTFCGTLFQGSFCKVSNAAYNWTINIDSNGPVIEGPKSKIPAKGNKDLNILHLTDIHYDPLYTVGALAECDEPLCCQRNKSEVEGTSRAAGFWGDYRYCDIPWHTIVDSLDQIKRIHPKIDFIYNTGDIIDHAVWKTSREKNTEALKKVNRHLKATFGDIPVYPTIGNHEPHPFNIFAPSTIVDEELGTQWLYDLLAELWSVWLPDSTKETIKKGGYYTVSNNGLRIIALNNNDCYNLNWWILYEGSYLSEQLQWLHDVLLEAENNNEYVHILAHIPTGVPSCWDVWSREFGKIVERFSNIISGIFNGHTHNDEMAIYYSNQTIPINVAWNGGSLTTYDKKNPNYRMYQVETSTFQVVEHETWYFNLSEANAKPDKSPSWKLEYKMTEAFELRDLSPASIDGLLTKFSEKPSLLRKYWKYFVVKSDPLLKNGCDAECLKKLICLLARGDNTQTKRCEELQVKLQEALDDEPEVEGGGSGDGDGDDGKGKATLVVAQTVPTLLLTYIAYKLIN